MPHIPTTTSGSYPVTSVASDPYQKLSVSGSADFTTSPQQMSMPPPSMSPVQLSLVGHEDSQQQPLRNQYAYAMSWSSPTQLSLTSTADNTTSVPRYADDNPRPTRSPRHASHQSISSASSMTMTTTSNDAMGEYRYGSPYGVGSGAGDHPSAYGAAASHQEHPQPGLSTSPIVVVPTILNPYNS